MQNLKKKIVICIFLVLILITSIFFIISAVKSYQYDMDPANHVDILEGFGAVLLLLIGGFTVFYEIDLLFTVLYFFSNNKTKLKTMLNIMANLCVILVFFSDPIADFLWRYVSKDVFAEDYMIPIVLLGLYFLLRAAYLMTFEFGRVNKDDDI